MKTTDISAPDYFHKVVDCQWACPAHTPVPEYIRLIAHGRYSDAYMINWRSNVFPGILGRTCDRPCEPACRRVRGEGAGGDLPAQARCRRLQDDITARLPSPLGKTVNVSRAGAAERLSGRGARPRSDRLYLRCSTAIETGGAGAADSGNSVYGLRHRREPVTSSASASNSAAANASTA